MNRQTFNALCAQYATPKVSGDGLVSWDSGKKCVIPSVTLYGAAVQDGEPTPENPVMPVCNNGVFAARGRNLLDFYAPVSDNSATPTLYDGLTVTQNGLTATVDKGIVRVTGTHTYSGWTNIVHVVFSSYPVLPAGTYTAATGLIIQVWTEAGEISNKSITFTLDEARLVRGFYIAYSGEGKIVDDTISLMLIRGDTTPESYTPYYDGGQAQAPELWTIPGTEYRDEWNPQTGRGIRRIKKLELDGTEGWSLISQSGDFLRFWSESQNTVGNADRNAVISDRLATAENKEVNGCWLTGEPLGLLNISIDKNIIGESTAAAFVAYLAAQYAAGAPITVWFAIATPEPFYHPPAKLTMPTGYGQIIQTSGDVPDCPITARYLTHS